MYSGTRSKRKYEKFVIMKLEFHWRINIMDYRERRYFLCRFDGHADYDRHRKEFCNDIDLVKNIKSVKIHQPYNHFKNSKHSHHDSANCKAAGYVQNMVSVRKEYAQQLINIIQYIKLQNEDKNWRTNYFEITKEICGQ